MGGMNPEDLFSQLFGGGGGFFGGGGRGGVRRGGGLAVHGEEEGAEALCEPVEGEGRCGVGGEVVLGERDVEVLDEGLVVPCHRELVLLCRELQPVSTKRASLRGGARTA